MVRATRGAKKSKQPSKKVDAKASGMMEEAPMTMEHGRRSATPRTAARRATASSSSSPKRAPSAGAGRKPAPAAKRPGAAAAPSKGRSRAKRASSKKRSGK